MVSDSRRQERDRTRTRIEEIMASTNPAELAAGVRWDLSDLYAGPEDPAIDADLDRAREQGKAFASRYRGRVAELSAAD